VTGSHGAYGEKLLDSFGEDDDEKEGTEGKMIIVKDERRTEDALGVGVFALPGFQTAVTVRTYPSFSTITACFLCRYSSRVFLREKTASPVSVQCFKTAQNRHADQRIIVHSIE
jgi:hypothetical protein